MFLAAENQPSERSVYPAKHQRARHGKLQTAWREPAAVKTQLSFPISDIKLWDLETPVLYEVKTELLQNGNVLDENITLFGFRTAVFLQDGFLFKWQKSKAARIEPPSELSICRLCNAGIHAETDADILKNELA